MLKLVIAFIVFYQKYLSPLSGPTCRFYPSCSHYSKESIERHGLLRGGWYAFIRLMKCHPFHAGGYDPVK
ncbi:membrane protein insertion efficiency factor YidD [Geobacter sp.]|uniref:membrane protein insertion efficiency factor YidD n=1 Tax=Geobacter sp. TaxID=46610 RepID=UPI002605F1AB|nr:membrane protein insertion efficiency factor YidD [Geobacter sp.]